MRKCIRCNTAMVENCGIKVKGAAYGLVLTDDENMAFLTGCSDAFGDYSMSCYY